MNRLYYAIESRWTVRKGNIQNHDELPQKEQIEAYAKGELAPHLSRRTPWMNLDYDSWDTRVEEMADDFFPQPREKRPRKLYRRYCTQRELSILDRTCSVDGIPWTMP